MAATVQISMAQQIYQLAAQVEKEREPSTDQIARLFQQINQYLSRINVSDIRCQFFAFDLRRCATSMKSPTGVVENMQLIATKVRKAVVYLERVQAPRIPLQAVVAPPDPALSKALAEGNGERLQEFTKRLRELDTDQVMALFDWALDHWDLYILYEILKKCPLSLERREALVDKAFKLGAFKDISYPFMLNHFTTLSEGSRAKIVEWVQPVRKAETGGESFQRKIEARIRIAEGEGALNDLLDPAKLKTLEERVIRNLLTWADDNDDDTLACYLIENDIVGAQLLNEIVNHSIDSCSFDTFAGVIDPHKLHLLDSSTQERVREFSRRRSTLRSEDAEPAREEEKFNTVELCIRLQEAIDRSDPREIRALVNLRDTSQLSTDEFWKMVVSSLNKPTCLREVLSSPYFKADQDLFIGQLFELADSRNWEALGSLMASNPFTRVPLDALFALTEKLEGAPPAVLIPFEERLAECIEELPA